MVFFRILTRRERAQTPQRCSPPEFLYTTDKNLPTMVDFTLGPIEGNIWGLPSGYLT